MHTCACLKVGEPLFGWKVFKGNQKNTNQPAAVTSFEKPSEWIWPLGPPGSSAPAARPRRGLPPPRPATARGRPARKGRGPGAHRRRRDEIWVRIARREAGEKKRRDMFFGSWAFWHPLKSSIERGRRIRFFKRSQDA